MTKLVRDYVMIRYVIMGKVSSCPFATFEYTLEQMLVIALTTMLTNLRLTSQRFIQSSIFFVLFKKSFSSEEYKHEAWLLMIKYGSPWIPLLCGFLHLHHSFLAFGAPLRFSGHLQPRSLQYNSE